MRMQLLLSLVFGSMLVLVGLELITRFFWYLTTFRKGKHHSGIVLTLEKQFLLIAILFYLSWGLTRVNPTIAQTIIGSITVASGIAFFFIKEKFSILQLKQNELFFLFGTHLTILALNFCWASNFSGFENLQLRNTLPVDNVLPSEVARYITESNDQANLFGDWRTSDRPPLSTGAIFLLRPFFGAMNYHNRDFILLIAIQFLFLVAVYHLVKKLVHPIEIRNLVFVSLIFSTSILLNYAHTWPKLLATSYVLMALASLVPENYLMESKAHPKIIPFENT